MKVTYTWVRSLNEYAYAINIVIKSITALILIPLELPWVNVNTLQRN